MLKGIDYFLSRRSTLYDTHLFFKIDSAEELEILRPDPYKVGQEASN